MNLRHIRELAAASKRIAPPCKCAACGTELPFPQHVSGQPWTPEEFAVIGRMRAGGLSWAYIGRTFHAVPATVRRAWLGRVR